MTSRLTTLNIDCTLFAPELQVVDIHHAQMQSTAQIR